MSNIRTHLMHVTFFKDARASVAYDQVRSLSEIAKDILGARAATKKDLPWVKMARFGTRRTSAGSLRHNANVRAFSGIEIDYDGKVVSFKQALKLLRKLKCRALIYTSPSYTEVQPKWRILLPTSREIWEPEIRRVLVGRVDGFFGNIFAAESYTLSQAYYYGAALDNPAPRHQAVIVDGDYVDLRHDLARYDEPEPPAPDAEMVAAMSTDAGKGLSNRTNDNVTHAPMSPDDLEQEMRAALMVIRATTIATGSRSAPQFATASAMLAAHCFTSGRRVRRSMTSGNAARSGTSKSPEYPASRSTRSSGLRISTTLHGATYTGEQGRRGCGCEDETTS